VIEKDEVIQKTFTTHFRSVSIVSVIDCICNIDVRDLNRGKIFYAYLYFERKGDENEA